MHPFTLFTILMFAALLPGARSASPSQDADQTPSTQPSESRPSDPAAGMTRPQQSEFVRDLIRAAEATPIQPIAPIESPGARKTDGTLFAEGTMISDRPATFERAGNTPRLVINMATPGSPRLSMEVNRNQFLELLEREADRGVTDFVITAEVSAYRGANYLTLRKVLRRVPHGNISP